MRFPLLQPALLFVGGFPLGSAEWGPNLLRPQSGQHLKQCKQLKALSPSLPFQEKLVFFPLPLALYFLYHSPFSLSLVPSCKSTTFLREPSKLLAGDVL